MKRAVITGATGLIGRELIEKCINEKIQVLAICRKNSEKINDLPKSEYLKVVECNLEELNTYRSNEKYDIFYHFAWEGTNKLSRNDVDIQNKNIKYTLDAVKLAKQLGCHTFIGAGSQAEFGRTTDKLNSNTPTFPESAYGIAKLCAGQLSRLLCNEYNMKHIWTRILSIYGPYDQSNTLIMSILESVLTKKKINLTKCEQLWDFLYSSDAANAMYLLGQLGRNNKIYCLGSGESRPLKDYILDIKKVMDVSDKLIEFGAIPYPSNQVMNLCADITDLKKDTGFDVNVKFEDGIKKIMRKIMGEVHNDIKK